MATFVGIDLGASNTRFITDDGEFHFVDNNFREVMLDENLRIQAQSSKPGESFCETMVSLLDVEIHRHEGSTEHINAMGRYLIGELAVRMGATSTPTALQNKAEQSINYINAIVNTALGVLLDKSGDNDVEGDVHLYVALPPVELSNRSKSAEKFNQELRGTYTVKFKQQNKVITFRITDVTCIEESFLTLVSFLFTKSGGFREENLPYHKGTVLGLDIGASTTDLAVMKDMKFLDKSGQTYKVGGNFVIDWVSESIRAEFGYEPAKEDVQTAIETGKIMQGGELVDISGLIVEAKKEFAVRLVEMMSGYFTKINIPPQSFKVVVVGGGGSMPSEYVDTSGKRIQTSPAMSELIWNEFKKISPNVPVISVGSEPRKANIIGLYIRAFVDKMKRLNTIKAAREAEAKLQAEMEHVEEVDTPVTLDLTDESTQGNTPVMHVNIEL